MTAYDLIRRCAEFDAASERIAISILKLASWLTTVVVALYGLWRSVG